ncbi:MAG: GNAT family N-acetyltransferase [Candidatus Thorarchaeota archaeon]
MIIATRDGTVLRFATPEDLPRIDEITLACYSAIQDSFVNLVGPEIYQAVYTPEEGSWKDKKNGQNHHLFENHPDWVWVLEQKKLIIGYVTFRLFPSKSFGQFENNGVDPHFAGKGWGKFMYRHVLQYFRDQGLQFAHVETDLDDPHIPARRAYKNVGFDREVRIVLFWQDLSKNNPGSVPE